MLTSMDPLVWSAISSRLGPRELKMSVIRQRRRWNGRNMECVGCIQTIPNVPISKEIDRNRVEKEHQPISSHHIPHPAGSRRKSAHILCRCVTVSLLCHPARLPPAATTSSSPWSVLAFVPQVRSSQIKMIKAM